jgi:hypothetical protein
VLLASSFLSSLLWSPWHVMMSTNCEASRYEVFFITTVTSSFILKIHMYCCLHCLWSQTTRIFPFISVNVRHIEDIFIQKL